jgi:hypothetical protein
MTRTLSICLITLLAGPLVASCGSSASTSASGTASTATATSSAHGATSRSATGTSGGASSAALQQTVEFCKKVIHLAPALSASEKTKLEGICNKAERGDLAGAARAAGEVCVAAISTVPPSGARERALAACKAEAAK